ncbi:hypothetical protein IRZ71_23080 [Flavobacterium sp. ANB]|uniref:hypothetical protein n=1 Tax=unclassified Flavobacterium TaxID=196869 RepID=UPI0012B8DA6A|nr:MULTISPECIES: hypothetical protein [unclassified Flavobacterium]MBF4519242.1 hypothetical protein [Flavobacterium sp. ANB]MTD71954.1 hypothetical protein [Flavobacterium sp. LC2016-13]
MKKKFTLEIASPCSENFDKMIPNASGSFCGSCAKNVIDLSRKTNSEVAKFIAENKDATICARLKTTQLEGEFEYNEFSKINNLKYAAVAASILIASNITAQEKTPVETEINTIKPNNYIVGKVAYNQNDNEEVSILVKGKLLETKTNKPLNKKTYRNLVLTINGSESTLKVNPETGAFSIPVQVLKNSKTLVVTVTADDYYFSKTIPFTVEAIKNNVLWQNIFMNEEELSKVNVMIMGGLGINYSRGKDIKQI